MKKRLKAGFPLEVGATNLAEVDVVFNMDVEEEGDVVCEDTVAEIADEENYELLDADEDEREDYMYLAP